jgi:hypothetical protein
LYVDLTTATYSNGISACERIGGFTDPGNSVRSIASER